MTPDIREIFAAYQRGDVGPFADALATDAVWVVPGHSQLAGKYTGLAGILELFEKAQEASGGSYQQSLVDVLVGKSRVAVVYRARGQRPDASLDIEMILMCRLDGHLLTHITALPCDPEAFQAFWA